MNTSMAPTHHMGGRPGSANTEQTLYDQLTRHAVVEDQKPLVDQANQSNQPHLQHHQNIDPAIAGPGLTMSRSPGDNLAEDPQAAADAAKKAVGKGGRELSTSKRAAQNRAAQRAFRQRKEGHIKKLEEQVRNYSALVESHKRLQEENYTLRDYIIALQSRLIDTQGDFPPVPNNIDIHAPRHDPGATIPTGTPGENTAPTANMGAAATLQANAAQALEGQSKDLSDRTDPALMATQRATS